MWPVHPNLLILMSSMFCSLYKPYSSLFHLGRQCTPSRAGPYASTYSVPHNFWSVCVRVKPIKLCSRKLAPFYTILLHWKSEVVCPARLFPACKALCFKSLQWLRDWCFSWFFSVPVGKCQDCVPICTTPASFHAFTSVLSGSPVSTVEHYIFKAANSFIQ